MTRGKYATRAANRLAELDNDLFTQKCEEVERLTARVAELETQLTTEKRRRDALIIQHADELAAKEIATIHGRASPSITCGVEPVHTWAACPRSVLPLVDIRRVGSLTHFHRCRTHSSCQGPAATGPRRPPG